MRRLREALHDSADEPRFIETLPRRGYRFIAEIAGAPGAGPLPEVAAPSAPSSTDGPESREATPETTGLSRDRRAVRDSRWRLIGTLALAAIAGVSLVWLRQTSVEHPPLREVALTTLVGAETSPTLAPDGEHVAFAWSGPNQDNRTFRRAEALEAGSGA